MEIRYKYILVHRDGYYINRMAGKTTDWMEALSYSRESDALQFLESYYAPADPENYSLARIKVTYELEGTDYGEQRADGKTTSALSA